MLYCVREAHSWNIYDESTLPDSVRNEFSKCSAQTPFQNSPDASPIEPGPMAPCEINDEPKPTEHLTKALKYLEAVEEVRFARLLRSNEKCGELFALCNPSISCKQLIVEHIKGKVNKTQRRALYKAGLSARPSKRIETKGLFILTKVDGLLGDTMCEVLLSKDVLKRLIDILLEVLATLAKHKLKHGNVSITTLGYRKKSGKLKILLLDMACLEKIQTVEDEWKGLLANVARSASSGNQVCAANNFYILKKLVKKYEDKFHVALPANQKYCATYWASE